jgi:hypothetical protein
MPSSTRLRGRLKLRRCHPGFLAPQRLLRYLSGSERRIKLVAYLVGEESHIILTNPQCLRLALVAGSRRPAHVLAHGSDDVGDQSYRVDVGAVLNRHSPTILAPVYLVIADKIVCSAQLVKDGRGYRHLLSVLITSDGDVPTPLTTERHYRLFSATTPTKMNRRLKFHRDIQCAFFKLLAFRHEMDKDWLKFKSFQQSLPSDIRPTPHHSQK